MGEDRRDAVRLRGRGLLITVALVAVTVLVGSAAAAQDEAAPDLGSGWQLRLEVELPTGSFVAGNAEVGFVVWALESGETFWSPDGLEWQSVEPPPDAMRGLAASDSGFVGPLNVEPTSRVLSSADGRTWEQVGVGVSGDFLRVESGPDGFVLVGEQDCALLARFSSDGSEWQPVEAPGGCSTLVATPTSEGWIAVAEVDEMVRVLSSGDGTSWVDVEAASPPPDLPPELSFFSGYAGSIGLASLSSDGRSLVLAGAGTEGMWVSVDRGDTWSQAAIDPGRVEMTVSDLGYVGVSPEQVIFSADGTTWIEYPVPLGLYDVASAGDLLVALASDGIYTWTPTPGSLAQTGTSTTSRLALGLALVAIGAAAMVLRWRFTSPSLPVPSD